MTPSDPEQPFYTSSAECNLYPAIAPFVWHLDISFKRKIDFEMPPFKIIDAWIWRGSTLGKLLLFAISCSFEAGHKGTKVISSASLKPSWAEDGKTFICRHKLKK